MIFLLKLSVFIFLYKRLSVSVVCANETTKKPPNIIIILADDMGFDDVSFRGSQEYLTPNIDALAYHGRLLDRLYAPAMCTPSRSALLTGRYPIHTGTQHFVISNEEPWALPTNVTTMAEVFRDAGYATNLVGKWHLGFARHEYTPTYRGFDYHYGYWGGYVDYYQRRSHMLGNYSLGYDFRRNLALECAQRGVYLTDLLTQEAERIIEKQATAKDQKPLFLLLSHLATHSATNDEPLQAPPEVVARFGHIQDPNRRKYAAMASKLDESVGSVVSTLARTGELANSIVLFYSDNGAPSVGLFANTGKNWPLRGQKNTPWEGGVRVAGAIWSPLLETRAEIFRSPIHVADWLPTLANAAGITLPDDVRTSIDGLDMWPQLVDETEPQSATAQREILHNLDDIWHVVSLMRGQYKYINGSTAQGRYDNLLTYRETDELDPRAERYVVEVRNSPTSRALSLYDKQRLSKHRIETMRAAAGVLCPPNLPRRACNTLIEECLYDLSTDPCEQNNLVYDKSLATVLTEMRQRVEELRQSAWPPANRPGRPEYDPSVHACTWSNFLEEPAAKIVQTCDFFGLPCDASIA